MRPSFEVYFTLPFLHPMQQLPSQKPNDEYLQQKGNQCLEQANRTFEYLEETLQTTGTKAHRFAFRFCFTAFEVAEWALKGGLWVTGKSDEVDMKKHNIGDCAKILSKLHKQLKAPRLALLPDLTWPMRSYYYHTRFPDFYEPPDIPAYYFTLEDAKKATDNAKEILSIVNDCCF